jgi:hypothetical protein
VNQPSGLALSLEKILQKLRALRLADPSYNLNWVS